MEKVEEKIKWAKSVLEGSPIREKAYGFDKIYPFATENISGYLDLFDLKDKSLLTVGSSSDQTINASLEGCSDITVLDINPYTEYYYYLKMAAILGLDREKFFEFLCSADYPEGYNGYNENALLPETFEKISDLLKNLSYDSYYFWSELYKDFDNEKMRYYLFAADEYPTKVKKGCNKYLQNDEYFEKVKKSLQNTDVKFIVGDIFDSESIKEIKNFDSIWLSNIGTYLQLDEIKNMTDIYSKLLTDEGKLMISYLYMTSIGDPYNPRQKPIYNREALLKLLEEYDPEYESFVGINGIKYNDKRVTDSVLVYKKNKNN